MVTFSSQVNICSMTPRHENENDTDYYSRLMELYEYRKNTENLSLICPFHPDELAESRCIFEQIFRSSFLTSYYNMYIRESVKLIYKEQDEKRNILFFDFQEGIRFISSGINKETLYIEVRDMAEEIEEDLYLIPVCQKLIVFEAQDPINTLSFDRLREIKSIFLTIHFPIIEQYQYSV